jgi:2-(3-amino-3-carboxypropyl)histidine synthase
MDSCKNPAASSCSSCESSCPTQSLVSHPTPPTPKRIISAPSRLSHQIPPEILNDSALNDAISRLLPSNYRFEVPKCVWQIRKAGATRVALQLPEGLQLFATALAKIFENFCGCRVVVLGDVTYGACCVDDFTARALGCDFMIHYGHSCLVPVTQCLIKVVYVFVEIVVDTEHVEALLQKYFIDGALEAEFGLKPAHVALVSTVQFISTVHVIKQRLESSSPAITFTIPQSKPLSQGEILGCTAPQLQAEIDCVIYLGDGRFHLEAIMIANPRLQGRYFRYDPYSKRFSLENYAHESMLERRKTAIDAARSATSFGLILGTLGRQGSPAVLEQSRELLKRHGRRHIVLLMSEIKPTKLAAFKDSVDVWVQVACPRLSIDWSSAFDKPLLTPYELNVALGETDWRTVYPMDFYAKESLGPWTPNHQK